MRPLSFFFSCCRTVTSRLHFGSVGIILSLASMFPPFWQIQVFPLLPEGRISAGVLARVEHAAGKTWYQRAGEDLESEEAHSWALEEHSSSHIHHPTRAPLTSSFLTQWRTEHLSQAGFLSLSRTCNLNSIIPFRASFSKPRPWACVIYFDKLYFRANYGLWWLSQNTYDVIEMMKAAWLFQQLHVGKKGCITFCASFISMGVVMTKIFEIIW